MPLNCRQGCQLVVVHLVDDTNDTHMSVVQSSRRAATDTAWSSCTAMVSVVGLAVGVLSVLLVFLTLVGHYRFAYYRQYARQVAQRQQRLLRADKLLDALAGTLRATANPDAAPATSLNPATDTLMLVFTDIQDSTTAAAEHPNAMAVVQEIHDRLMRQGIQVRSWDFPKSATRFRVYRPNASASQLMCVGVITTGNIYWRTGTCYVSHKYIVYCPWSTTVLVTFTGVLVPVKT